MVARAHRWLALLPVADEANRPAILRRLVPAIVLLTLLCVLSLTVRSGLLPGDEWLATVLMQHRKGLVSDIVAAVNHTASVQVWAGLVLWSGVLLWLANHRKTAVVLVTAVLSGEIVVWVVKWAIARPRPPGAHLVDLVATNSFPSGHVMRATVALVVLMAFLTWRRSGWRWPSLAVIFGLLLLAGGARISAGDHWPSDVVGGYLLGLLWVHVALVTVWVIERYGRSPRWISDGRQDVNPIKSDEEPSRGRRR